METGRSIAGIARGAALLSVLGLVGVLLYYVLQPGYSQSRLALFVFIAGAAVLGGIGVVLRRFAVTIVGAVGLFLLGFWQAVLSVFIFPVIGLLLVTAFLDREEESGTVTS